MEGPKNHPWSEGDNVNVFGVISLKNANTKFCFILDLLVLCSEDRP